jgi:pSer/pThr/pTyr-binding forkhead associated (FHA) protein
MASEEETEALAAAERQGDPYLVFHDADKRQRIVSLPDSWERVTVGRSLAADVVLSWDDDVSRVHADLQRMGDEWVLVDEGLSRNGTFLNGERVEGRRMLRDGDELRFGQTVVRFNAPFQTRGETRIRSAHRPLGRGTREAAGDPDLDSPD